MKGFPVSVAQLHLRDLVFQAAARIAGKGGRVTVSSVKEVVGRGNPSEIQDYLVEWRQERRNSRQQPMTSSVPETSVILPALVKQAIDHFTHQLGLTWADALAASSTDDQLTVIRAAAEARIREATDQMHLFEEDVVRLKNDIMAYESEKSALNTALDEVNERAAEAEALSLHYRQQVHQLQDMVEDRVGAYEASEALYQKMMTDMTQAEAETAHLSEESEALAREAELIEKVTRLQQQLMAVQTDLAEKECLISQQQIDLQSDDRQKAILKEKDHQIMQYQETIQKQQNWIQEARQRMAKAGLIRGKQRK